MYATVCTCLVPKYIMFCALNKLGIIQSITQQARTLNFTRHMNW